MEDDGDEDAEIAETGYRDADGEMRRPWCPATRILEHRESEAQEREAERKREAQKRSRPTLDEPRPQLREDFPVIKVSIQVHPEKGGKRSYLMAFSLYIDIAVCISHTIVMDVFSNDVYQQGHTDQQ